MFAGTAIGAAAVWAALSIGVNGSRLAQSVLAFVDAKPEWFYPAAYLVIFEMSVLFWDIRSAIRDVVRAASNGGYAFRGGLVLVLVGSLCAMGIAFSRIAKKRWLGLLEAQAGGSVGANHQFPSSGAGQQRTETDRLLHADPPGFESFDA